MAVLDKISTYHKPFLFCHHSIPHYYVASLSCSPLYAADDIHAPTKDAGKVSVNTVHAVASKSKWMVARGRGGGGQIIYLFNFCHFPLICRKGGIIVNLSSVSDVMPLPFLVTYAATKVR